LADEEIEKAVAVNVDGDSGRFGERVEGAAPFPLAVPLAEIEGGLRVAATFEVDHVIDDAVAVHVGDGDGAAERGEAGREDLVAPVAGLAEIEVGDAAAIAVRADGVELAVLVEVMNEPNLAAGIGEFLVGIAIVSGAVLGLDPGEFPLAVV